MDSASCFCFSCYNYKQTTQGSHGHEVSTKPAGKHKHGYNHLLGEPLAKPLSNWQTLSAPLKKITTLEWRMPMELFTEQDQSVRECQVSDPDSQVLMLTGQTEPSTEQNSQPLKVKSLNKTKAKKKRDNLQTKYWSDAGYCQKVQDNQRKNYL